MSSATAEAKFEKSADEVWSAIRDFGDCSWHGGVATCVVEGDIRTVTMEGMEGLEIDERLLEHDDAARTYTYAVVEMRGPTTIDVGNGNVFDLAPMIGHQRATITVTPTGESSSFVSYSLEMDAGHDDMLQSTSGGYGQKLETLRSIIGG